MAEVKIKIEGDDILDLFKRIPLNYEYILDTEIGNFMENLRLASTTYHPWISQSYKLERSHKYNRLGPMEWQFTVDTTGEAGDSSNDYNYAPLLENNLLNYSKNYTWVDPQFQRLYPQLISSVRRRFFVANIKNVVNSTVGSIKSFLGF
jgi:hypothetical protein